MGSFFPDDKPLLDVIKSHPEGIPLRRAAELLNADEDFVAGQLGRLEAWRTIVKQKWAGEYKGKKCHLYFYSPPDPDE